MAPCYLSELGAVLPRRAGETHCDECAEPLGFEVEVSEPPPNSNDRGAVFCSPECGAAWHQRKATEDRFGKQLPDVDE